MANGLSTPITGMQVIKWVGGIIASIVTIVVIVYFASLAWKKGQE